MNGAFGMSYFKSLVTAVFLFACTHAIAQEDEGADNFFLLDVNSECFTTGHILGEKPKLEYNEPPPLAESNMAVYKSSSTTNDKHPRNIKELKQQMDAFFANGDRPDAKKYYELMDPISPQALIDIIESTLKDEKALNQIAKDSYRHVTDFTKIVLVEGEDPHNYKVRLHLWWPKKDSDTKKLAVEDKHVHKWDFTSRMFAGKFENQIFVARKPTEDEKMIHNAFIEKINKLPQDEQKKIFESINMIEMALYKKSIFNNTEFLCHLKKNEFYTLSELLDKFKLDINQFKAILAVHERYVTQPNVTGRYNLKKIGLESLNQPNLYDITDGTIYIERYQL